MAIRAVRRFRKTATGLVQTVRMSGAKFVAATYAHPYLSNSPWNWGPLPATDSARVLDANSAGIAANLASTATTPNNSNPADRGLGLYEYGVTFVGPDATVTGTTQIPITASTPRYTITFTQQSQYGASYQPFGSLTVPIPHGTLAPTGSDGHLSVIDPVNGKIFSMWRASYNSSTDTWSAAWGAMVDLQGDGREPYTSSTPYSSTASALARPAGVIRLSEIAAGVINHALFFSSDMCTPNSFRYPASKTDGDNLSTLSPSIMQGTRIGLPASLKLSDYPKLTLIEQMVFVALQVYGAFCGDKGGERMAIICEKDPSGANPGTAYSNAGAPYDYQSLSNIPWNLLQVYASSTGT